MMAILYESSGVRKNWKLEEIFPGRPEIHKLNIPAERFQPQVQGNHTLTIHVNPNVAAGLKDDFVLKNIQISDNVGARIGWS